MTKKVFLPNGIADDGKEYLQARDYELIMGTGRDEETMIKEGKDADAILVGTQTMSERVMSAMPNLQVIARNGVGFDGVDIDVATKRKIYTTITPQALSESVAESTVTMILALAKNIYNDSYQMRQGNLDYRKTHQGIDLKNKTVGILGFGRIGQMVASMLQVFGVNILIFDPHASDVEFGELVSRETIFEKSDIITIHLPLVDGTRGSISTHEFESMKSTAMIVNLARGPIIDTDALVTALRTNEIAAAGLDVFDEEPLAMNSPLFELENVLVTPHIASNTVETKNRMAVDAASEIDRVLQGKKPKWAVNQF